MIAALWGQLEQCAKQIMPWSIMSCSEAVAKQGFLLNYLTSSMPGSLFRSLKRRHFLVSLGICGSLLLRLAIIFSSGLLRLEYRSVTSPRALGFQDTFDLSKSVDHAERGPLFPEEKSLGYWSILKYGLSYPSGTTPLFAVQSFTAVEESVYEGLSGEVQVFESTLQGCESFDFTYDIQASGDAFNVTTSTATPPSVQEKLEPWCFASATYVNSTAVLEQILGQFLNRTYLVYRCTDSISTEDQDHRVLFTAMIGDPMDDDSEGLGISGFLCEPTYSLTRRVVTNTTHDAGLHDNLEIAQNFTEPQDLGIRPIDMTQKILYNLGEAWDTNGRLLRVPWGMWVILMNATQPQSSPSSFTNTTLNMELSKRVWQGVTAYLAKREYTNPSNQTINGTTTSIQPRICVQELPLRLVEAPLVLLLLSSMVLCFLRPGAFHRDPTSLGAHAMILARNSGLMALLESHGSSSKQTLRDNFFEPSVSHHRHIPRKCTSVTSKKSRRSTAKTVQDIVAGTSELSEWWRPVAVRLWFRICTLTASLGVMIALEVMLQVAAQRDGLGNVSLDGYLKYTWTLLPTFVLALIGLLFSMVDSAARTLHPFRLLRKGRASLADIMHDPSRHTSLMAVLHAAWKRHFALLWAILPGLLAPILTIIVSGLYTAVLVPWTYTTELQLKDRFRPENHTLNRLNSVEGDNGEAWTNFALTQISNLSYPQWTQGEYALAQFGADNLHSHEGNTTSLAATARVPAAHVDLNCILIGHYSGDPSKVIVPVDRRQLGCGLPQKTNQTGEQDDLYLHSFIVKNEDGTGGTDHGYYLALLDGVPGEQSSQRANSTVSPTSSARVCDDGRQHYFISLGNGTESLAVLHCAPYVESLWVTAEFTLPHLSLVTDKPVQPESGSSKLLSDSPSMTAVPRDRWKDVFSALANGSSRVGPWADMMPGPDDNTAPRLTAAVEGLLSRYFAQSLHLNSRQSLADNYKANINLDWDPYTPDGKPANATVTDRTRLRLIQNEVSTRILQGLLGVMVLCLIAESVLVRGGRIIPRDPGSIASRMAYFAGGELWRRVPVGAERWTDEEIIKWGRENCEGGLLLDWWEGDRQEAAEDGSPVERTRRFAVDSVSRKGVV